MNILVVGGDDINSIESIYHHIFQKLGSSYLFPAKTMFRDHYRRSALNKLRFKLGLSSIYKEISQSFKEVVEHLKPDVILIFKGMELDPYTLEWASKQAFLVMYNPDHPFIYSGKGSGNSNMTQSLKFYDLYITYANDIQEQLEKESIPAGRIAFGHNLSFVDYEKVRNEPEERKACFLGNGDDHRAAFLNDLSEQGVPVVVHGDQWRGRLTENIEKHPGAYGIDFWRVMRRYRVQLNIMRPHNVASHNMRSFDIPAVGGIGLMPDTPEHREFFSDKEVVLYKDLDDASEKAKELLSLDENEARDIRNAARKRCVESGYSYSDRAYQLYQLISTWHK